MFLSLRELLQRKYDYLLSLASCLPRGVSSMAVPAAMALTACMPPGLVQLDKPYAAAPADPAVYWHDYQTSTANQQTA